MAPSIRVLLVDEDRTILNRLGRALEGEPEPLEVLGAASSSSEAVALARKSQPDVILLDMGRREEDRIDAIPRLGAACSAHIVVFSSVRDPASSARAVKAGARGVVLKGDAPETIRKAVHKVNAGELWLDRRTTGRVVDELVARHARPIDTAADGNGLSVLTEREREVVRALLHHDGAGSRDLAERLRISEHTLRNHFTAIYRKLGVTNRTGLFAYASKLQLGHSA